MDPALDDDTGNFNPLRKQHVVGVGDVPLLSGNAIRGVLRRLVMRHFLSAAGMTRGAYSASPGQWDRIYGALANGGALTGAEKGVKTQFLRELRAACPPLSLFGAALYTQMLPGMFQVFDAYPRCREVAAVGFCSASDVPLSSLYGDRNHVRHVSADVDREAAEVKPMPYTSEVFYPGAVLEGGINFDNYATEIERDCAAWAIHRVTQFGGNTAKGFGLVDLAAEDPIGDPDRYDQWIDEHATKAKPLIEEAIPARMGKA
ncbi:MAG: hypothetical protein ACTHJ3_08025 [Pararhizobium sp.]